MLVIDENMFRLAKMQETLLKVSNVNRIENLNNYKKTVAEIDAKAYADVLEEIKHIDEHNQSLEDEALFLQGIKNAYDQLFELQSSFKRVCETYHDMQLELSDLSRLNIEYVDNRISVINGYLINIKNIEINKERLQELNEKLIVEEKNKITLDNKLLEMENTLKNNFINSEGRFIKDGKLEYTSVISEYNRLGFDFKFLLENVDILKSQLLELENKKVEANESVRAAEICYNSILSDESKQVLKMAKDEFLMIVYKITLLKIVDLLRQDCFEYQSFINKRESLIDLIKYRNICLENIGMNLSIDPFSRTKVKEQYELVLSLKDNSKEINRLRKEIGELNSRTEEMINQNNSYLISLNDTKELVENRVGISDINITDVKLEIESIEEDKDILENQIVAVKDIPNTLNMNIVNQKTDSVIKRVCNMIMGTSVDKKQNVELETPELVIIPSLNDEEKKNVVEPIELEIPDVVIVKEKTVPENNEDMDIISKEDDNVIEKESIIGDIFETVNPFETPVLFDERKEDITSDTVLGTANNSDSLTAFELKSIGSTQENNVDFQLGESIEEFPDAFWVMQEDDDSNSGLEEETLPSFDDQINALLSSENKSDGKVRKKVA